ncbi:MAG: type IV pilus modification PilV family protein, partial [Stenotrophobium sp.]
MLMIMRRRSNDGFTLVEVMVALLVLTFGLL